MEKSNVQTAITYKNNLIKVASRRLLSREKISKVNKKWLLAKHLGSKRTLHTGGKTIRVGWNNGAQRIAEAQTALALATCGST